MHPVFEKCGSLFEKYGIYYVEVEFNGYGDDGNIDYVNYEVGQNAPPMEGDDDTIIENALIDATYDVIDQNGMDWINNEGGFGTVEFNIADKTIVLHYNQRIETSEYSRIEF